MISINFYGIKVRLGKQLCWLSLQSLHSKDLAGGLLQIQGQSVLQSKIQASLGWQGRTCFKKLKLKIHKIRFLKQGLELILVWCTWKGVQPNYVFPKKQIKHGRSCDSLLDSHWKKGDSNMLDNIDGASRNYSKWSTRAVNIAQLVKIFLANVKPWNQFPAPHNPGIVV